MPQTKSEKNNAAYWLRTNNVLAVFLSRCIDIGGETDDVLESFYGRRPCDCCQTKKPTRFLATAQCLAGVWIDVEICESCARTIGDLT